jgi:RNA methyltransferase, TrmH family
MITSTANLKIKQIRKLKERKERKESGLFYVEGLKIIGAAVEMKAPIDTLIFSPEMLSSTFGLELIEQLKKRSTAILEVSSDVFRSLSLKENPQGIGAVVGQQWMTLEDARLDDLDYWTALDSIQDPGNLGTILRTNDAAGGKGVILLDNSTDPYDPTAVRASMGAVFTQKLIRISLEQFSSWVHQYGYSIYGTSDKAKCDYRAVEYRFPMILLMGSEQKGLSEHHLNLCDEIVSIAMEGKISDSLNIAIAASLVLYELFYQQKQFGKSE